MKRILFVDFSNISMKAHFSTNRTTEDGRMAGCFYQTLRMIGTRIEKYRIDKVCILFDRKKYWRSIVLPEYKAGRTSSEDLFGDTLADFVEQRDDLGRVMTSLGWSCFAYKSLEADDLASGLCYGIDQSFKKKDEDYHIFLLSSDHDWKMLINDHVSIIKTKGSGHDEIINIKNLEEHIGLPDVETYLDALSIAGDKSDSIPSIFGKLEETADGEKIWKDPPRIMSVGKVTKLLASPHNTTESLLEGNVNSVHGVGTKTEDLFLNITPTQREYFERNKKIIDLTNKKEKWDNAMMTKKNEFPNKVKKTEKLTHMLFDKYECITFKVISDFPGFYVNEGARKDKVKVSNSMLEKMKKRRK